MYVLALYTTGCYLILSFAAGCPPGGVSPRRVLTSVPLSSVVTFAVQQLLQVLVFPGLQHHQCGAMLCVCVRGCVVWGVVLCVCVRGCVWDHSGNIYGSLQDTRFLPSITPFMNSITKQYRKYSLAPYPLPPPTPTHPP